MTMRGGKLRKRITVQAPDRATLSAHGNPTRVWRVLRTVWAAIEPIKGRESWQGMQVTALTTHGVTIRYFKNLTSDMRFLYAPPCGTGAGRTLNIEGILNEEERNRTHHVTCIEGGPVG